ncbi:MAG: DUF1957 domain-containing protein [Candidatus Omnitrophica bacterium]|nr:DUF1957 domain-containing protein [Candidatus Omnitrophota bacterium]
MEKGYLSLILHAHLPFVRHPEHPDFLEERWFFEALTETYIPLLSMLEGLQNDKVDFRLTINISPTLAAMLQDELLLYRFEQHLNKMIELSGKEIERTRFMPEFNKLAHMYHQRFSETKKMFLDKWQRNLPQAFKAIQETGKLEIITCCATHGYLPLIGIQEETVKAQVRVGVSSYRRVFGTNPKGIWLPECGYFDGLDKFLKEEGIKYFILETHGVIFGVPRPKFGVYSGYWTPNRVGVFGRDMESSKSVWSAIEGYPGDYSYREYYRDIGFDLDYNHVQPYIAPTGERVFTGIKYYKITGETEGKQPYIPEEAREKSAYHAGNFMFNREKQIEYLSSLLGRKPIIICPYDAELFGHWWFEGISWLNFLIRKACYDQNVFKLTTPFEYLKRYPKNQVINPAGSSWGYKGYSEVWLGGYNDWIYPHLHRAAELMARLARNKNNPGHLKTRILNQMTRELLLAQSSDWPFILKTQTFTSYAEKRIIEHLENFYSLYNQLKRSHPDEGFVANLENKNNPFSDINYSVFSA